MSQSFKKLVPTAIGLACLLGWLAADASAQGATGKNSGSAVPAIVDQTTNSTTTTETGADPIAIPIQRLAVVFVVICTLIYLTYFGLKRYVNWQKTASGKRRSVGVIDTIPLGGKRFVTVTRVYDRILVLGVGEETITLLTELNDEEMNPATGTSTPKPQNTEKFLSLISALTRKKRDTTTAPTARAAESENALL